MAQPPTPLSKLPNFDPERVPVIGVDHHMPAVPAERLSAQALRQRFAQPPAWQPEVVRERKFAQREPALASVLVGIVTVGPGGIEWMNRSARRMFGCELEDVQGQPMGVLAPEDDEHAFHAEPGADAARFDGYRAVPWFLRKAAITQLPSVNALTTLRALPAATAGRREFIGFGDPYFSKQQAAQAAQERVQVAELTAHLRNLRIGGVVMPMAGEAPDPAEGTLRSPNVANSATLAQLSRLPETADEIRDIAQVLKADMSRDVFLGVSANEKNVKTTNLADRKIVAFATHGLVPGDLNGLDQPALALTAPDIAGIDGDGLLTMEEILNLKLNADWVVLSACNTGSADGAGSEAVSGLGRAFFYAGARSLLVSNWPVETNSARLLTTDVFKRSVEDPALSRAEALRQTMLWLMDNAGQKDASGKTEFTYAHPMFWAPFALIGDGGR